MNESIISIENLSKRYIINHQLAKGDGIRHIVEQAVRSPAKWLGARRRGKTAAREEFWALRDVDIEIGAGETVGIVGRNGAGKSTLLKLLSRITEPTRGRIRLRGRVASLLEVGTGFHPELTGRENVFLNGAVLGMTRREIKRKFDEIVSFASIEKFLDTPVKRYSSGMYVRLAFAVAAHLEPDILIVDEVLAVGDAQFQKKCLDKMDDVGNAGRTVIFVSHNMQAVTRLCKRGVLLEKGRAVMEGPAHQVANAYMSAGVDTPSERVWENPEEAPGDRVAKLRAVRTCAEEGRGPEVFDIRKPVGVVIEYDVLESGHVLLPHFVLTDESGVKLFVACDVDPEWRGRKRSTGRYTSTGWIPGNLLNEGAFSVNVSVLSLAPDQIRFHFKDAVLFRVVDDLGAKDTARGDYGHPLAGAVRPMLRWTTDYKSSRLR